MVSGRGGSYVTSLGPAALVASAGEACYHTMASIQRPLPWWPGPGLGSAWHCWSAETQMPPLCGLDLGLSTSQPHSVAQSEPDKYGGPAFPQQRTTGPRGHGNFPALTHAPWGPWRLGRRKPLQGPCSMPMPCLGLELPGFWARSQASSPWVIVYRGLFPPLGFSPRGPGQSPFGDTH